MRTAPNCTDIAGATDDTYTPGEDDIGHAITVVVTASNSVTDVTVTAPVATAPVGAAPPHDTVAPVVSGTVELGGTLTADTGTWSGTPTITYSTSGSAATRTATTARTSTARPTTRTRSATTTRATPSWSS